MTSSSRRRTVNASALARSSSALGYPAELEVKIASARAPAQAMARERKGFCWSGERTVKRLELLGLAQHGTLKTLNVNHLSQPPREGCEACQSVSLTKSCLEEALSTTTTLGHQQHSCAHQEATSLERKGSFRSRDDGWLAWNREESEIDAKASYDDEWDDKFDGDLGLAEEV